MGEDRVVYHKGNYKKKVEIYRCFGQYENIPLPMCNSKLNPYVKVKRYYMVRNWAQVTCKKCLKGKDSE